MTERANKLVGALPEGFGAALVQTQVSRFYLLDYDSHDAGTLLILPDRCVFIIDSRYIEAGRKKIKGTEIVLEKDALAQVGELLKEADVSQILVENEITVAMLDGLRRKLAGVAIDASPTLSKTIMDLRMIKDDEELRRMRAAQAVTDDCFAHIRGFIKVGMREVDIALEMEHYCRSHGAEAMAFDTICVAGPNSSLPHGVPGEYRIQPGDLLTLDFGAKCEGYCADMTRTLAVGEPGEEKRKLHDLVLRAHNAGIEAAGPGKKGNEVDAPARKIIIDAGYGENFGHGLGHALGIEVHEEPRFSPKCSAEIKQGMVLSVEPGVYLPGKYGCRIEDAVLITADGCEPLPESPKELIVL